VSPEFSVQIKNYVQNYMKNPKIDHCMVALVLHDISTEAKRKTIDDLVILNRAKNFV